MFGGCQGRYGNKQAVAEQLLPMKPLQAIINLLDNAIKYSQKEGSIKLRVTDHEHKPAISISDSGPGIPTEERDKVLQRFYRMDSSRSQPGSGLGLSLVAAVAEMHNAKLKLGDNHPGVIAELEFQFS